MLLNICVLCMFMNVICEIFVYRIDLFVVVSLIFFVNFFVKRNKIF